MLVPKTIPGLRLATVLLGLYGVACMLLEGSLVRISLLGVWATAVAVLTILERLLSGRRLGGAQWLAATSLAGLLCGAGAVIATVAFMALHTGIHGHGPEYTSNEIAQLWANLRIWSVAGLVAGLGLGLLAMGRGDSRSDQEPPQSH